METAPVEPGLVGGRFRLQHLVKSGGGVETWRGADVAQGTEVAVKMLAAARVPIIVRTRLQHEARVLQSLHDSTVTPLIDANQSGGSFYLVVPWVKGHTLEERLRRGPLPVPGALRVGRDVLQALSEAHESGVLHRDVKPSNIIVEGASDAIVSASLIDFGFARSLELESSLRDEPVGTVEYVSPEQAGLVNREVDERSDLYSVGVVLFECLVGHPPFEGHTPSDILRQHVTASAPALPDSVPHALNEIVQRLLRTEPRDRYQSASGVRADLVRVAEALERGVADPPLVIGLQDERQALAEPAFVGRTHELGLLGLQLREAADGRGSLVLLEAESGVGKTRLLDEFDARSRREAWILRGQALAEVAQQPFELFVGLVHGLLTAAHADKTLGPVLRDRLGARSEAVCAAMPDLAEVLGPCPDDSLGPETLGESRTFDALVTLIESLGTAMRPAVILLDDCQWGDEAALKLLVRFQQRRIAPKRSPCHVLIIAAFRSEEVGEGHPLRVVPRAYRLSLPTLAAGEVRALVESMAGALPEEAVQVVGDLAVGSPFMATAVLRGMVESGALVSEGGAFRVETPGLEDVRSSGQAAVFLRRRLARLPPATSHLLSVGAVLGREFDVDLAASLAEFPVRDAMAAVTEARHRGILWTRAGGARSVFVHDKLREALLVGLAEDERRRLHLRAALALEATDPGRAFDIAYHFDAARAPERALPYALSAADLARSRHALATAETQYLIARRGAEAGAILEGDHQGVRQRVAEGLGDILMLRGRYDEAAAELELSRTLARATLDEARLRAKLGELAFKRGDMDTSGHHIELGLTALGRVVLRRRWAVLAGVVVEVIAQALHVLLPRLLVARRSTVRAQEELVAIHLYSRLAHISWFQRGNLATLWAHLREMNLAERYPPTAELAQAYSEHAPVMTMLPWYSRGRAYALRSLEIRRSLGDVWGQGQSLHFLGVVLYAASRFKECRESCREAVRLLERTGDRWEINTAQWHIAYCQYRLGHLASAVKAAESVYQAGVDIGDAQARGISLSVWAKASRGAVSAAMIQAEIERGTTDVHTRAELLQAQAIRLIGSGRPEAACGQLKEADRMIRAAGMKQEYVAPVLPWLLTALRIRVEEVSPEHPSRRSRLLREGLAVSHRALRLARRYRNNLPQTLRERALLLAVAGRPRRARQAFDESLACADELNMKEEAALTRRARGAVGALHGWVRAQDDLASATPALAALQQEVAPRASAGQRPFTVSIADRFDQLLDAGRQIASALTKTLVYAAVRTHTARLLRADQCLVFELNAPDDEPAPVSALDRGHFSRSLVKRAVMEGKPVILPPESVSSAESAVLSGARSGLCAPIRARGKTVACFYAAHYHLGGLFGEVEARLAQFVATVAGAALENAEGVSKLETLSEERGRLYREAQEAIRARDEFLSIAAHELKTPLTSIGIQLATLDRTLEGRSGPLTSDQIAERLRRARRQFDRIQVLIAHLLDMSRAVADRLILHAEETDLVAVAREVVERSSADAETNGCALTLRGPEKLWGWWDRVRLQQVITNLVSNALKFGAGQPVEVELSDIGDRARLRVRDHGIGIANEDQARIFERFERAVSMRHYGGFGLGLWIIRELVAAMRGTISVESAPGQGAVFTVELPRREMPTAYSREGTS